MDCLGSEIEFDKEEKISMNWWIYGWVEKIMVYLYLILIRYW